MILLDELLAQASSQLNSALFLTPPYHKGGKTVLFRKPAAVITCCRPEDAGHALAEAERAVQSGLTGYGLINYETGFLFEKRLHPLLKASERPLFRFCFFEPEQTAVIDSAALSLWNDDEPEGGYSVEDVIFNTSNEKYINDIGRIKDYIAEGDTYHVNYTMQAEFCFEGSAAALFKKLLFNQSAKYTAYINTPDKYVLSLSPELFFKTDNRRIETRPMKGTARRGLDAAGDSRAEEQLYNSSKDRAENIMIVDLLRNDLGRISRFGSVKTKDIFDIEKYESVFQMVSTVRGTLRRDTRLPEILKEIFPCGSITGAPKIRTMEIIHELEGRERGLLKEVKRIILIFL